MNDGGDARRERRKPIATGGKEGAEANARRQSRAEVAGGRGFMAARAAMKRVVAGNRDQGASIALDRRKAPGMKEAGRVDARRADSVLGWEWAERRDPSDEGVRGNCPESFGESRRSSQAGVERRRAETSGARELAESPDDRTRSPQGGAVANPLDPRSAEGRGNVRAVAKARGASSNALRHEGVLDGLRSAGNPTQIGRCSGAEKHRVTAARGESRAREVCTGRSPIRLGARSR
jgi:hypothetical protein